MKTLAHLVTLGVLCTMLLGACATVTPQAGDEMINPGDKIGDFLIQSGDESVFAIDDTDTCSKQGEGEKYLCEVPVGRDKNVSMGVYDDQYAGKLDELWSEHSYEMTINGRLVNLKAFGSIDRQHPTVGMMRHWNVVIGTDKPGEITVHSKGVVGGDPFEDTTTYLFVAP